MSFENSFQVLGLLEDPELTEEKRRTGQIPHSIFLYTGKTVFRSHWPNGLRRRSAASRLLRLWEHGCLSVVSVMCCQVEVSATS